MPFLKIRHSSMVLEGIRKAMLSGRKLLAILIDPDKFEVSTTKAFLERIPEATTHIFIGGSTVELGATEAVVRAVKSASKLPIVLFPGDHSQLTGEADALLFLSLLSGRNPEYLIGQQVRAVPRLRDLDLAVIPTGYLLIDGGRETAVQRVTQTQPLSQNNIEEIVNTALAGQYSGKQLIYLEAGSGAAFPVSPKVIAAVKGVLDIPLIVGGGIRTAEQLAGAYQAGADVVVMGTVFEGK